MKKKRKHRKMYSKWKGLVKLADNYQIACIIRRGRRNRNEKDKDDEEDGEEKEETEKENIQNVRA